MSKNDPPKKSANRKSSGNLRPAKQGPPPPTAPQAPSIPPVNMSRVWSIAERHCLHIMATHYPDSIGRDRAAIFNHIFGENVAWEKLRDEYGGHKAGNRNRPNNQKPTRSVHWNDHVCRDEFNNGGFDAQQAADRAQILQQIQGAINALGLAGNAGLGNIRMLPGMTRADTNATQAAAGAGAPAGQQRPAPTATGGNTAGTSSVFPASSNATVSPSVAPSTPAAGSTSSAAAATNGADPASGGRAWYHSREVVREGNTFVYRPNQRIEYDNADRTARTWPRQVRFPDGVTRDVRVCNMQDCNVCGRRIRGG